MDARYRSDSNESSGEKTGYTHANVMEMCKSQKWKELKWLLGSSIKDLTYKILATAVFEAHHPDEQERKEYGLSNWDKKLHPTIVPPMLSLFDSRVDLLQFYLTYMMAKNTYLVEKNEEGVPTSTLSGLEDSLVAEKIKNYVQEHKFILGKLLEEDNMPLAVKEKIESELGNLSITADVENQEAERQLAKQREEQTKLDLCKKAGKKLEKLFSLTKGSCNVSYSEMMGYNISFTPTPSVEDINEYTKILKNADLKVSFYNFPNSFGEHRGIQFSNTIQEMVKTLDEINNKARQSFLNTIRNSGSPLHQRKDSGLPPSNNLDKNYPEGNRPTFK